MEPVAKKKRKKKNLNNESGLTVASMGSSTPGCTLCAFYRDPCPSFTARAADFIKGGSVSITRSFYRGIPPL